IRCAETGGLPESGSPGIGRTARDRAVPEGLFESDLPAPSGRTRAGIAPATLRRENQNRPRYGSRVQDPFPYLRGLSQSTAAAVVLRRGIGVGSTFLCHGTGSGDYPESPASARFGTAAATHATALRAFHREFGRNSRY